MITRNTSERGWMFHTVETIQRSHVKVAGFKLSVGPECLTCNKNNHVYNTLKTSVTCQDGRKLSDCRREQTRWGLAPSTDCYRRLVKSDNKFMKHSISFFSAGKRRFGSIRRSPEDHLQHQDFFPFDNKKLFPAGNRHTSLNEGRLQSDRKLPVHL